MRMPLVSTNRLGLLAFTIAFLAACSGSPEEPSGSTSQGVASSVDEDCSSDCSASRRSDLADCEKDADRVSHRFCQQQALSSYYACEESCRMDRRADDARAEAEDW